jgi:amino-acid N-acetyltransferase
MSVTVEAADTSDLPAIRKLLEDARLPHSDLQDDTTVRFWVARDGEVIGAIGLESFGTAGLVRSLVVSPLARRHGLGDRLVRTLESSAVRAGLRELVLLTQTAEQFFADRGYAVIERSKAPAALRESSEFKALCPASATCMSKALDVHDRIGATVV